MAADVKELYRKVVVDHGRRPRHFGVLAPCTHQAKGHNRMCGDKLSLFLCVDGQTIEEASFDGAGCAIMMASASMLMERLQQSPCKEAEQLCAAFFSMIKQPYEPIEVSGESPQDEALGQIAWLGEVRAFPSRIKCATLPWEALQAALQQQDQIVSTEL